MEVGCYRFAWGIVHLLQYVVVVFLIRAVVVLRTCRVVGHLVRVRLVPLGVLGHRPGDLDVDNVDDVVLPYEELVDIVGMVDDNTDVVDTVGMADGMVVVVGTHKRGVVDVGVMEQIEGLDSELLGDTVGMGPKI